MSRRRSDEGVARRDPAAEPQTLESVLESTWAALARAVRDRRHGFRTPVVATVCPERGVRARTVVLREVERASSTLVFYTDRRSGKLGAIDHEPQLSLCFYDPKRRIQVRAEAMAAHGRAEDAARAAWSRQGAAARALYAVEPAPATPIDAPDAYQLGRPSDGPDRGFEHFVRVACRVEELDWLHLGRSGHRRARFEPDEHGGWSGRWIVP